ncbi:MAG: hypothetical protein WCE69_12590 [Aestuariivirga sp.]
MSKINSTHTFGAAVAVGAVALFSMLSFGGKAEAASGIFSCQGATAGKVVSCCEAYVKQNGRPFWMIQSGTNCHAAAVCRGGKNGIPGIAAVAVKRCYILTDSGTREGGGQSDNGNKQMR